MSLHPDFVNELRRRFTGEIRLDRTARILYSTDASIYQIEPLGVVFPRTQEDLHAAVELAVQHRVPILPRGAGTSLAGQAIGEALILDCSRWLNRILEIDPQNHTATVEPGVVLSTLNRAAARFGLQFGPDPASAERATLGGVIGNNATGAHSILYGMTADHLLEAEVLTGEGRLQRWGEVDLEVIRRSASVDGEGAGLLAAVQTVRTRYAEAIRARFPRSWRNSAGYRLNYLLPWSPSIPPRWDEAGYGLSFSVYRPSSRINLAALLAGSEGTLAVIRRATLNLVPRPRARMLGLLAYESIVAACEAVPHLLEHQPSAIELIPRTILRRTRSIPAYAAQVDALGGDAAALLVVEFAGDRPEVLREAVLRLRRDVRLAESAEEQARVWNIRKVGLGILDSRPQSARPVAFIEDCAIPVERLGEFVREIERILAAHHTEGGIYAHASAGCLHIRPVLDLKTWEGVRALRSIAEQTLALTLRLGGSMSSEHGDGLARGEWLRQVYGEEVIEAMRLLKQAVDPHGLLNPGKMFDAPAMDTHLRYGAAYTARGWSSPLRFERNGGLEQAIEQCNGQGVCLKDSGVMCPSFQATRQEEHATRGRANLLRALIRAGGHRPPPELMEAVFQALDLCLACKGCKAECPSGVDMAKLKFAFLHEYYKTHRRLLRDYLFGYFHIVAAVLSAMAPLANWSMDRAALRSMLARALRVARQRPFPRWAVHRAKPRSLPIRSRSAPSVPSLAQPPRRGVVLFLSDPIGRYIEPEVEQAAFDLLEAFGFEVRLLPVVSAGAAMLSRGFLSAAQRQARRVLRAIERIDPQCVLPLVGVEPSEMYTLKHEYLDLLPEEREGLLRRAGKVWLVDEFLVRQSEALRVAKIAPDTQEQRTNTPPTITFHPHCHQQAEGPSEDGLPTGTAATVELLRRFGCVVRLTEAGCCGLAGAFGYDAEHYALSMKIGEQRLFPTIRNLDDGTILLAAGAACRMQIAHGTGARAMHPLVWLASRLQLSARP